jgi:hypothetical protein
MADDEVEEAEEGQTAITSQPKRAAKQRLGQRPSI